MGAIVFTKSPTVLTFPRGLVDVLRAPRFKVQPQRLTDGGTLITYNKSITWQEFPLSVDKLPASFITDLSSFWHATINGKAQPFTYTDPDGVTHTVRWMNGFDPERSPATGLSRIEISLRKEG